MIYPSKLSSPPFPLHDHLNHEFKSFRLCFMPYNFIARSALNFIDCIMQISFVLISPPSHIAPFSLPLPHHTIFQTHKFFPPLYSSVLKLQLLSFYVSSRSASHADAFSIFQRTFVRLNVFNCRAYLWMNSIYRRGKCL